MTRTAITDYTFRKVRYIDGEGNIIKEIALPYDPLGCVYMNNVLIIADHNNTALHFYDDDGVQIKVVSLGYHPYDLECINGSLVVGDEGVVKMHFYDGEGVEIKGVIGQGWLDAIGYINNIIYQGDGETEDIIKSDDEDNVIGATHCGFLMRGISASNGNYSVGDKPNQKLRHYNIEDVELYNWNYGFQVYGIAYAED